ncbi:hypothetical protein ASPCAL11369 [Aspergillus calidoustus]|uniref:C2H2-type domain-containing protein n=1 Tax=Aspergillus calidoustus TaxID=454130 RepID=A0A0U5CE79_ASPCI|nr:hypothetical protein ASPCAL11369 [Aspergillus calidoustus]
MSAEQYSSGAYHACEGLETDHDKVLDFYPVVHSNSSVDIMQPENAIDRTGLASSLVAAQPYWRSLNADLWVPSTQDIASGIPMLPPNTELPYEDFGYPDGRGAGQSINLTYKTNTLVSQILPGSQHPTPQVVNTSPRPNYTSHGKPSTQRVSTPSPRDFSPRSLKCEWRGCTYTGTFSRPAQLKRHADTQHIYPGSFVCPVSGCDKTFNRKDNLGVNLRQMHHSDEGHPQCQTGKCVIDLTGENVIDLTGE